MRRLFLIGMLCLMVKVTFSQEQDSIKQYDLDEVVVSATRSNTQLKNIPQKVEKTGGVPLMFAYKMVNTILKFDFI